MTIRLRMLRRIVCYDGEPTVEYYPQVSYRADPTWHAMTLDADKSLGDLAVDLSNDGHSVSVEAQATTRLHQHIGEYGSPNCGGRCTALDGIK